MQRGQVIQKQELNKLLDLDPALTTKEETTDLQRAAPAGKLVSATAEEAFEEDFGYARSVVRESIDQAREAAVTAIELAQSGDSARAYEVVAGMLTAIVNANKELLVLHKTKEDTRKSREGGASTSGVTIEKAVFVGRASDLLRELRTLSKAEPKVINIEKE
jgi:hypothetical protein